MLNESMRKKLSTLRDRHAYLSEQLSLPKVIKDQEQFRSLSKEYSDLEAIVNNYRDYLENEQAIESAQVLLKDEDLDMRAMADDEIHVAQDNLKKLEQHLQLLLLPKDPHDARNAYLEIRAGAGGDEAGIFAGDLYRMYERFAQLKNWRVELLSSHMAERGGFKEVICMISGLGVYGTLKYESGAHRVQRVPETEAQGRIHTSTCTVAVLPEIEEIDEIKIDPSDLKIDTYRSSGAGGQHVNTTDSAIRITHLPTGIIVECQDERSQHKNRARAMSILGAKILDQMQQKQRAEQAQHRKSLVGTGDRSERIRTYNFPQGRLTDHRINLTLYKLENILEGNLQQVIDPLTIEDQAEQLASLDES